jgi:hypothetical protein
MDAHSRRKSKALKGHNTAWHAVYAKTLGPHISVDTEAKNDERKLFEQEESDRQFVVIRYIRMMLRDPAEVNNIIRADTSPAEPYQVRLIL